MIHLSLSHTYIAVTFILLIIRVLRGEDMEDQFTERFISPPLKDIKFLQQKLTAGELDVLYFLHRQLSLDWEIYIQPHLNGLCPDFVILNPKVGIVVINLT